MGWPRGPFRFAGLIRSRIDLLYTAPDPILDGNLMNTLYTRTDEPMLASGLTGLTMVNYVDINDPTRLRHGNGTPTP